MNLDLAEAVVVPALEKIRRAGGKLEWIQPETGFQTFPLAIGRASVDEDGDWFVELYDPDLDEWGGWWHFYTSTESLVRDLRGFLHLVTISLENADA